MSENKKQTMVEYVEERYQGRVKDEKFELQMELAIEVDARIRLINILYDDARLAFEQVKNQPQSQFFIRTLVRTIFGHIEAELSMMRQFALTWHRLGAIKLTDDDLKKLADEIREFWDKSQIPGKSIRLNLIEKMKFTFKVYGSTPGKAIVTIDTSSPGYQSFVTAVKIRNNLMHPKVEENLLISEDDAVDVVAAWLWYSELVRQARLSGD